MGDHTYFRAEGQSLEIIQNWTESVREYRERMLAIQDRIGADGVFTYNDHRVAGFSIAKDVAIPKHLRRTKDQPECVVPNRRLKLGQELWEEMNDNTPASQMQLTTEFLGGGPFITGTAPTGGHYMGMVSFETLGDTVIIGGPHLQDGEVAGHPPDAGELKKSEYWALKEAAA